MIQVIVITGFYFGLKFYFHRNDSFIVRYNKINFMLVCIAPKKLVRF